MFFGAGLNCLLHSFKMMSKILKRQTNCCCCYFWLLRGLRKIVLWCCVSQVDPGYWWRSGGNGQKLHSTIPLLSGLGQRPPPDMAAAPAVQYITRGNTEVGPVRPWLCSAVVVRVSSPPHLLFSLPLSCSFPDWLTISM